MQKLQNIKAIFVDIDRTLTNDNKQVPLENSLAIKKAIQKGIMVVLCSGRNFSYAQKKAIESNSSEYLITNNGAQIYNYVTKKSVYENIISRETTEKFIYELRKMDIEFILNTSNTRFGSRNVKREIDKDEKYFDDLSEIGNENVLQIVCEVKSFDSMDRLINKVKQYDELTILNFSKTYLENKKEEDNYYADINDSTVNKGKGIEKFLEMFNIKKQETICFGDYINDKDMFDICGFKVAMGNASKELKKKANFVTLSNNDAGVGYFINNFIL